jgi:hypothetical protein
VEARVAASLERCAGHHPAAARRGIFGELKSDNALGYVPTRTWVGNQIYLLSVLLAHNLGRKLQIDCNLP